MTKVFIDGSAGTTGLRIYERLNSREDINLIILPDELRKDTSARAESINSADIAFLCLPDAAAVEAVGLVNNKNTAIIDTSTAHRTSDDWQYGFAEIDNNFAKIQNSKRIANPGCHASGFIALVKPLIAGGALKTDAKLSCFSLTGYSGGGKQMIAQYRAADRDPLLDAPRMYALPQQHKHLAEMVKVCGLENAPVFAPIVADYYAGMQVSVPLFKSDIKANISDIKQIYKNYYNGEIVKFVDSADESGFLSAAAFSGRDDMQITVTGNDERIVLVARYDNLGKGASGSAIENMNILLGAKIEEGLNI
ncbi:MAG: N-acetyl-gamma-glutamyl-phosphate reductase [Clostridia bacterium]|nr:N-acetyl-gamma-glutamyl-phosphate reductase [Clostridia bacterium]